MAPIQRSRSDEEQSNGHDLVISRFGEVLRRICVRLLIQSKALLLEKSM
jgi:hypothetical protein